MKVNALDGALTLPAGFTLQTTTKIEEFRATGLCAPDAVYNPGTPWYYHRFSDGKFEGHPLNFNVCFYQNPRSSKSVLVKCSFGASPWNESDAPAKWSLDVDAQYLELNLILVKRLLGKPHQIQRNRSDWKNHPVLQNCAIYNYRWGTVCCGGEDPKTSLVNSSINLYYSANQQWAHQDYKGATPTQLAKSFWGRWKK